MKSILADVLLYAALCIAGAIAGMTYESARLAKAEKAELQDLQSRTVRTIAWIRDQRAISEAELHRRIDDLQKQLTTEQGKANEDHQAHVAGLRAGTVSVRVPVVPASCPSNNARTTGDSGAGSAKAHAQLDPAAAEDLAAISHEGDASIRELNHCIDRYKEAQNIIQRWRETLSKVDQKNAQTY